MRWFRSERGQKFVREIGSVVLGVLIALAIGEVADAVRWRVRVDNSLVAMRTESAGNRFNVVERRMVAPCVERRLREIGAVLDTARRTGRLPMVQPFGRPPVRSIETAAYDVAQSEGAPLHMSIGQARDIALAYSLGTATWREVVAREQDHWSLLAIIALRDGPIDGDLLSTLAQAQADARDARQIAKQANRFYSRLAIPVEYVQYRDLAGLIAFSKRRAICQPLTVSGA